MTKKRNFIEDNPHLVYSPNAKASFEGNSGSGSGFPTIEYSGNALQIKASKLLAMVNVSPVLFKYDDGDSTETWGFIIKGFITGNAYYFNSLVSNQVVRFVASSADGKPTKI